MFVLQGTTAHFQQALAINAELGSALASLNKRSEAGRELDRPPKRRCGAHAVDGLPLVQNRKFRTAEKR